MQANEDHCKSNSKNWKISIGHVDFIGKNLSNFIPPDWKLDNPHCHIMIVFTRYTDSGNAIECFILNYVEFSSFESIFFNAKSLFGKLWTYMNSTLNCSDSWEVLNNEGKFSMSKMIDRLSRQARLVPDSQSSSLELEKKGLISSYSRVWNRRRAGNNRRAWKICQKE